MYGLPKECVCCACDPNDGLSESGLSSVNGVQSVFL